MATVDIDTIAQNHNLEGADLEYFQRYIEAHNNSLRCAKLSREATDPEVEKKFDLERGEHEATLWEMKFEMGEKRAAALKEYFEATLESIDMN